MNTLSESLTQRCGICRLPKGEHFLNGGRAQCPPKVTFFTPCLHRTRQGTGVISMDGKGWTDETCSDCGERIVVGNPPGYQAETGDKP